MSCLLTLCLTDYQVLTLCGLEYHVSNVLTLCGLYYRFYLILTHSCLEHYTCYLLPFIG